MKMILAVVLAGAFLTSLPVRADDNGAPAGDTKPDKGKKAKAKKGAKKDEKKDDAKAGGGW